MNNKKYELTDEQNENGLYRIRSLQDFWDVRKGDLGGFVESEANLSQRGDSWIYDDAEVSDGVVVLGRGYVHGFARVSGNGYIGS